ncbi:hypothetical protein ABH924_004414 [Arthrobacter sp. GAS37]|uniref:hypothetical protein n=1 Tax=Arthrobacter sp. GAS37 TaxID=3156261 RepID=UPI003833CA24
MSAAQQERQPGSGAPALGSLRNDDLFPDHAFENEASSMAGPASGSKRALGSGLSLLPGLEESGLGHRPLWKRPAILVSSAMALAVLAVAAVLIVLQVNSARPPAVSNLTATPGSANIDLRWEGPDVPYSVALLKDGKASTDLSYLVRGREAWIPKTPALAPAGACYIVRPAGAGAPTTVPATDADLAAQGAAKVCPKS